MLLALCAAPAAAQDGGRLRVVGRGVVDVAPDFATVRIGVSTRAPAPTAAMDQNSVATRKVIDFAKKFGVQERDIQTDAVALSPTFKTVREPNGTMRQEPDGYRPQHRPRQVAELPRLGTLMREVLDQGATNIDGVNFGSPSTRGLGGGPHKGGRGRGDEGAGAGGRRQGEARQDQEILLRRGNWGMRPADLTVIAARRWSCRSRLVSLQIIADVEMIWVIE